MSGARAFSLSASSGESLSISMETCSTSVEVLEMDGEAVVFSVAMAVSCQKICRCE